MSEIDFNKLNAILKNEKILLSTNSVELYPDANVFKKQKGLLILTENRILCLKENTRGVINKKLIGYSILFESDHQDIDILIKSDKTKNVLKISRNKSLTQSKGYYDFAIGFNDEAELNSFYKNFNAKHETTDICIDNKIQNINGGRLNVIQDIEDISNNVCYNCGNKISEQLNYCTHCISDEIPKKYVINIKHNRIIVLSLKTDKRSYNRTDVIKFTGYLSNLLIHSKYSDLIIHNQIPPDESYQKVVNFSMTGNEVGSLIGVGWSKALQGLILFNDHIIKGIVTRENPYRNNVEINVLLNITNKDFPKGKIVIEPRNKGIIKENLVGVNIKGNKNRFTGIQKLEDDKELLNNIFTIIKTRMLYYPADSKTILRNINFESTKSDDGDLFGIIHFGLSTNVEHANSFKMSYPNLCISCISIARKIADYILNN